ncbi:MAG: hypothetical protein R2737_05960 [Candidatus Nanopelagicales bacterium]
MDVRRIGLAAATLAAAGLALTGCGGKTVAEQVVGGDVEVNPSSVKISNDEGSIEIGQGSSLPDGWPEDVPEMPGFTLQTSGKGTSDGRTSFTAVWEAAGDQSAAVKGYVGLMETNGWTVETQMEGSGQGGTGGLYALKKGTEAVALISNVESDKTTVVMTVTPTAG